MKASTEIHVGKPRGKALDPLIHVNGSVTLLLQLGRKVYVHAPLETRADSAGETAEVPQDPCQHCKGILSSGSDSTQGLRPRHRRERNAERPSIYSHGDWPFLWPPDWVPDVPVVSQEHLPQLEKIQDVLPSRRDEAHFRYGVLRLITPNLSNLERVFHTLAATQEVP